MGSITIVLAILASAFGGFLAGYMKKKGENLATHEDIGRLVEQVRAVTTTTKEIEAQISSDVWDRQKQWEMKRDVLFDLTRRTAAIKDALSNLYSVYRVQEQSVEKGGPASQQIKLDSMMSWNKANAQFDSTISFVGLVCDGEVAKVFQEFGVFAKNIGMRVSGGEPDSFNELLHEFVGRLNAVTAAVRKELTITSLSPKPPK